MKYSFVDEKYAYCVLLEVCQKYNLQFDADIIVPNVLGH